MSAYYNEIEPFAIEWLKNLMAAGLIAPGDVDARSIEDVTADDVKSYAQCHWFSGFGTWSYALRLAGWPDDRKVWTASCPCQPFSKAGKTEGFADERHLWPDLQWLIEQCKPPKIFGEQVGSKFAEPWIDLVHGDLEALDYAFGSVPFASASIGAPHIRDRVYWVGHANDEGLSNGQSGSLGGARGREERGTAQQPSGTFDRLAYSSVRGEWPQYGQPGSGIRQQIEVGRFGVPGGLADTPNIGRIEGGFSIAEKEWDGITGDGGVLAGKPTAGPVNGFWSDADWLFCRDNKWRPVESGASALAHGIAEGMGRMQPRLEAMGFSAEDIKRILRKRESAVAVAGRNRVGRLKAYGNAINAQQAKEFIQIAMRYRP